jgi:putative GTP pyrophosphokinase
MAKPLTEPELRAHYAATSARFQSLCDESLFILKPALTASGIRIAMLDHRLKTEESFVGKAIAREVKDPDSITDVAGIRVVCLFLSDLPRLGDIVRDNFDVISVDDKIEGLRVSEFGYMSVHYLVRMKPSHRGPRYTPIAGLPLEIQTRTLLMHSWANVSHFLSYKSDTDIPEDLRRDFYAISGLFYMADKHFELFFEASVKSRAAAIKSLESANPELTQAVNLDSMTAYLAWKFPRRSDPGSQAISDLVSQVVASGYETLEAINEVVDRVKQDFLAHEKTHPPGLPAQEKPPGKRRYSRVGVVRVSLRLAGQKGKGRPLADIKTAERRER